MTTDQFCYWLQGLLELQPDLKTLDEKQVELVRQHLGYVFEKGHISPSMPMPRIPIAPMPPSIVPGLPVGPVWVDPPSRWPPDDRTTIIC